MEIFQAMPEAQRTNITPHSPEYYFKSRAGFTITMDYLYKLMHEANSNVYHGQRCAHVADGGRADQFGGSDGNWGGAESEGADGFFEEDILGEYERRRYFGGRGRGG